MSDSRIVVGVDGSDPAIGALDWAADLAAATRATLAAVLVTDPLWSTSLDDPRRTLERLVRGVPPAVRDGIELEVRSGDLAEELVAAARGDLLVIGTHKTGFLRGRVLGSRTLRIASLALGEVAIVPHDPILARRGIVVGLESHHDPGGPVLAAARHAERLGEELVIVHALEGPPAYLSAPSGSADVDPAQIAVASAAHLVAERHPGVPVRVRVSRRRPAEAFLDASRAARLLVVGATPDERSVAFAGGSVHDVILNVNAPLLVVPTPSVAVRSHAVENLGVGAA